MTNRSLTMFGGDDFLSGWQMVIIIFELKFNAPI